MIGLVNFIFLFSYYCSTLSAAIIDLQNEATYKIIQDEYQQFHMDLIRGNFNVFGINENCTKQLGAYINGLNPSNGDTPLWAAKMFDAMGKLEPSILEGNLYSLGSYDECLSIRGEQVLLDKEVLTISGKYCLAKWGSKGENISFGPIGFGFISLGTCMPSACYADDLNILSKALNLSQLFTDQYCQMYEDWVALSGGDIAVIVFLSLIGLVTTISTTLDAYLRKSSNKCKFSNIFISFSLISNGEKLFATSTNSDQLQCLSGIRAISMMWIVLFHMSGLTPLFKPISNLAYMQEFYEDGWTMYVRSGALSVDTFFLMSGIVLIYVFLRTHKTQKGNFNIFSYYLHRYIRLTPALAVLILINATMLRHFGSGPLWPYVDTFLIDPCKDNWWINLLYLQNFVNWTQMCMGHTWYLAVDTQLFLLSPLILIPLRRWKKQTLAMVVGATCASIASSFAFAWTMELHDPNSKLGTFTTEMGHDYTQYFYIATYNRAHSWLIGILVGYCIYEAKGEKTSIKINPVHNIAIWVCSMSVLITCVFYDTAQDNYDRTAMSFYIAFLRPAWTVALAWVIFACVTGHGGVVDWFLSLPIFHVLARLTYSVYLVHLSIIVVIYVAQKRTTVWTNFGMMYEFWSMYAVCLGVGIIWTLLFELPIIAIEKSLKSKSK